MLWCVVWLSLLRSDRTLAVRAWEGFTSASHGLCPVLCLKHFRYCSGDGLFLACEDLGRMFDCSFPACALFFSFFFFEVEISLSTLIPLSMPGTVHSGSAN